MIRRKKNVKLPQEKEGHIKPKVRRKREITKIRAKINKIKAKKIAKINETKIWVFKNINKIDKPLSRLTKKNKTKQGGPK